VSGPGPDGNYSQLYRERWTAQQSNGTFTNCLQQFRTGNLLRSVTATSSPNGSPILGNKWDNARLQYVGRSYGVDWSAGLTDKHIATMGNILNYLYHKIGFIVDTQCIRNDSMVARLDLLQATSTGMAPNCTSPSPHCPTQTGRSYTERTEPASQATTTTCRAHSKIRPPP
jgi:hypothetical protein